MNMEALLSFPGWIAMIAAITVVLAAFSAAAYLATDAIARRWPR